MGALHSRFGRQDRQSHRGILQAVLKFKCPADLERVISAGILSQWQHAHLNANAGGRDRTITRVADLVQAGVPLQQAANVRKADKNKRRECLDYANAVMSEERRLAVLQNRKLSREDLGRIRSEAAANFKHLSLQEKVRWRRALDLDRGPDLGDAGDIGPPPVDDWRPSSLWDLSSCDSFIADKEVEAFLQTRYGNLVGVSRYSADFRPFWRDGLLIKDTGAGDQRFLTKIHIHRKHMQSV